MNETEHKRILDDWLSTHRGLLSKVVRAYAFNPHDQEDLFQEAAFQLWNSIPNFKGKSAVSTWVYRIALYSGIEWSRKEHRRTEKQEPLDLSGHALCFVPENEDPRVAWLYEQVARLEPIDRSLMLLVLEGLSYREMAETLGISESNVGVKINRIKKALAEQSSERRSDGL
ncbi:MAG: RNA polymerase sigma-70 factor (ECF subfamily) [Planctomycetota bacterium]|jgi:RNA polymerase sigma-70 factor (ECF subfamily)